jgi:uncharacterized phage-associated protein
MDFTAQWGSRVSQFSKESPVAVQNKTVTAKGNQDLVTPDHVADYLLSASREAGEILTNLKLQKLLYYAQGWFLALHKKALFDEDFEAWVHGPVLPSQYQRFKRFGWKPIMAALDKPKLANAVVSHLDEILSVFGTEPAIALERMTHAEKPWREARGTLREDESSCAKISKRTMQKYYQSISQPA